MASSTILIRECTTEDFSRVYELLEQLWPDDIGERASLETVFGASLSAASDVCLCAQLDGRVEGFCSMTVKNSLWRSGRVGYVDNLVVSEGSRRLGVGTALLERAAMVGRGRGCSYLELDSGFHRAGAHSFYESQGFDRFGFMFGKVIQE
jgi:glucosamine-phosphate N-acetyltransferase